MTDSTTGLQAKIDSGARLLLVEVVPPKSGDPGPLRAAVQEYAGKVDAIGVNDNRHGVCMAALAAAGIVAAAGVEPILHMVTRDRNRVALLANCLGAQALGVRNILCTSGTHQTLGICRPAKNVFDIDSIQLLDAVAHLGTDGCAVCPERFEGAGPFCLGAVAAPFADPAELQLMRLAKKVNAGVQFVITQPVYDIERFGMWWEQVAQRGIPDRVAVVACIEPLLDAGQAQTFASSRPSPRVPQAMLERLSSAGGQTAQRAVGIEIAVETIKQLSTLTGLRGFQIGCGSPARSPLSCADGDVTAVTEIIERSGLGAC